ncbi:MAG: HU family DNA-binding protein [Prevotella sp.]|nr:HU family DNA-binding protein [Prevotella sp.]
MAVFIAVRQDKRKQSNNLWYGRTYNPNIIDTHGLAQRIQANVSVKKSDVYAVLTSLVKVMNRNLANSIKIKIDNFGYFYVSATTSGALAKDEWNVRENLKSVRVRFQPTQTRDGATGAVTGKSIGFGYKAVVIDPEAKAKQEEGE